MADNTIIQQGFFTSTGVAKTIILRSDVDWMRTYNLTTTAGTTQWDSVEHHWQRELPAGDHIIYYHGAATNALHSVTGLVGFNGVANRPGFYPIDSSGVINVAPAAVAAGTNVVAPVYTATLNTLIANGSIVRIYGGGHTNLNGLDFTVTTVGAGAFTLANALATAPGVVNGAGFWKYVAPDVATYRLFAPSRRVIANITAANPAVITTLVDHDFTTGQIVRMMVPAGCGMTQMHGLLGTVTAINAGTFSVNIDSTGFTAFNFPLPAAVPFTPAEVIPVGDNLVLTGATLNQGYIGMVLGSLGAVSGTPTGVTGNVIKWIAGKSFGTFIP